MKKRIPFLMILLLGLCAGGVARFVVPRGPSSEWLSSESEVPTISQSTPQLAADAKPVRARPELSEVLEAKGLEAVELLSRFLNDATMEEMVALMELIANRKTQIGDLMWMVQMRGLEMDAEQVLAWTLAHQDRSEWLDSLFDSWMRLDPHSALKASIREGHDVRNVALGSIGKADPNRAIEALRELHPHSTELKVLELQDKVESAKGDYPAALKDVLNLADPHDRRQNLSAIVEAWAKEDPLAALGWAEGEEDLPGRNKILGMIIHELAESQPALAMAKLDILPLSSSCAFLEGTVVECWANRDSAAALEWLKGSPAHPQRDFLYSKLASHLPKDPTELLTLITEQGIHINQQSSNDLQQLVDQAAMDLAKVSPAQALLMLESLEWENPDTFDAIATLWVERDPEAAAEWMLHLPETKFASTMQRSVIENWGSRAPEDVAHFLSKHNLLHNSELATALARSWVSQDPQRTIEWIDQLEGDVRSNLFSSSLYELAQSDPKVALQHLHEIEDETHHQHTLSLSIETWRKQDPEALMEWLIQQPDEASMGEFVTRSSQEWVMNDPIQASGWIAGMDGGRVKDLAIVGMISALTTEQNPNKDFDAAHSWINEVSDPQIQQQVRAELAERP